jgi:hypothetical protein
MKRLPGEWDGTRDLGHHTYICGFCGVKTGIRVGYRTGASEAKIFICGGCNRPTFFEDNMDKQNPSPILGKEVEHLPDVINTLYLEARKCTQIEAYTACILTCRKLLMHVAVEKEAPENISFLQYVEYLSKKHYIPPNGKDWVDHIRTRGNEANHEIVIMSKEDAFELLSFIEMLLKFIYEFPTRILPIEEDVNN